MQDQTKFSAQLRFVIRDLDPEYVSGWCRIEFDPHSQPFLLTYPRLIKAFDALSFLFKEMPQP